MKRSLKPVTFLLVLAASLGAAAVVWAYWTVSGSGTAPGQVADIDTPTFTSITVNGADVTIDWSDVAAPGGGAIDGYFVQRYVGSTPSAACGSSASTLLSSSNCIDTAVASGTYTYRVTAVFNSWTEQSAPSTDVVVAPATGTPPTAAFTSGCTPAGVCGTAADPQGVQNVSVSIQQGTGNYWNGTVFGSATEVFQTATLATPGGTATDWTYAFTAPADGSYTARVQAVDGSGNGYEAGAYAAESTFLVDTTAPTGGALRVNGVDATTAGSSSFNNLGGYAIDLRTDYTDGGSGLASSVLTRADGTLLGNACSAYGPANPMTGTPVQGSMATGCYLYTLTGTDNAGNTAAVSTTVKVDAVVPNGGLITANSGQSYSSNGIIPLGTTSFVDTHSGIAANTITRASASLSNDLCSTLSGSDAVTVSGGNDSATLGTGCYRYTLTGTDNAGNASTATSSIVKVDLTAPAQPSVTFGSLTNAHTNGTSVWFRGNATGGFTVTAASTDLQSGIASGNAGYTFNSLAANGFTGTQTGASNAYAFSASAADATGSVTASNKAGGVSTARTFSVIRDGTAPGSGAVTANGGTGFNTTGTVALSVTNFTDGQSGMASNTLTRASGTLSNNSCDTLSGAAAVTVSGGNDSATLTTGCYQYTLTGVDNVGNTSTATSGIVKVDTVAPTSTITFPADSRYYASSAWSGGCTTVGLCGTATDTVTGVSAVAVSVSNAAGLYWNGSTFVNGEIFNTTVLGADSAGTRTWSYAMSAPVAGVYTINVKATDAAGKATPAGSYTTSKFKLAAAGTPALSITNDAVSTNKRVTFTGTGGVTGDSTTVTIKVCQVAASTSPAPDFSTCTAEDTITATVTPVTGVLTAAGGSANIGANEWHYARATQTDLAGNTWTFVYGPFDS